MGSAGEPGPSASRDLERWLDGDGDKTLGGLIEFFGPKAFAIVFVVLLAVPALPLPTAGATHVFEAIAALLALELIAGRDEVWLPERWRRKEVGGARQERLLRRLVKLIRRLERFSRPRLRWVFHHRLSNAAFGVLVIVGSAGAFFAPPLTGLDTLPALGVVLVSLGVLLEDFLVVVAGVVVMALGIALELALGSAAVKGLKSLV